jgi:HD superfamily phosphodiesterase
VHRRRHGRAGGPNVYVGGRIGATLLDEGDLSAQNRPLDELRFPLDHFCTKILPLPVQMNTAPGRALAIERENFTKQFLDVMLNVLRPEITRD